jgi:hypothetical protein
MTQRHRAVAGALAGLAAATISLTGVGPAAADPAEPDPMPIPTYPVPVPPDAAPAPDLAVAAPADPAAPPPPPPGPPGVPEIPNPTYGSGKSGGGVFGTLMDIWEQVKNPSFTAEELYGSQVGPTPPPGAGPAPALPPGYVSTNAPGSETPASSAGAAGGSESGRPALPPGYYPLDGPPPPWYANPGAPPEAVPGS